MKIQVTQEDIDNGIRRASHACPIAYALTRAIPNAANGFRVEVLPCHSSPGASLIKIGDKKFKLPPTANIFAHYFDSGFPVKPFEFELDYENTSN